MFGWSAADVGMGTVASNNKIARRVVRDMGDLRRLMAVH